MDAGNCTVTKAHCLFEFCVRFNHARRRTLRAEKIRNESESLAKHSEGIELLLQPDFASKAHTYTSEDSLRLQPVQLSACFLMVEADFSHLFVLKAVLSAAAGRARQRLAGPLIRRICRRDRRITYEDP